MVQPRAFPRSLFEAAIAAADPAHCVPLNMPEPPQGRTIVVGAGKAAASMARTVEQQWAGDLTGWCTLLIDKDDTWGAPCLSRVHTDGYHA